MGKMKTPPTLAARVRWVRGLVDKLPMRTLSILAGLSPSMVGEIERGNKTVLESDTAEKLATACGSTLDWLLGGRGEGPDPEATRARLLRAWHVLPPPKKSGPKVKDKAVTS